MIPLENRFRLTKTSLAPAVNELLKNRKLKVRGIAALLGVPQARSPRCRGQSNFSRLDLTQGDAAPDLFSEWLRAGSYSDSIRPESIPSIVRFSRQTACCLRFRVDLGKTGRARIARLRRAAERPKGSLSQTEQRIAMLIVEDQDFMRQMLREYLQGAYPEAAILEAADGARALELCRSRSPKLVLMDVGLPDANGIDLTAQVKEMLPETAVIIVSQRAGRVYVDRARAAGVFERSSHGDPGVRT